jgi:hypothetical protein
LPRFDWSGYPSGVRTVVVVLAFGLVMGSSRVGGAQPDEPAPSPTPEVAAPPAEPVAPPARGAPPAPIVRAVPPGMEHLIGVQSAPAAAAAPAAPQPTTPAGWRTGFTLRIALTVGAFVASGSEVDRDSGPSFALAAGAFVSRRLAITAQLEGSGGGNDLTIARNLQLITLGGDLFVNDHIVLGVGVGQASTRTLSADGFSFDRRRGFGVHGRVGYLALQRARNALEVTVATTSGWFDNLQVITAGAGLAYRWL